MIGRRKPQSLVRYTSSLYLVPGTGMFYYILPGILYLVHLSGVSVVSYLFLWATHRFALSPAAGDIVVSFCDVRVNRGLRSMRDHGGKPKIEKNPHRHLLSTSYIPLVASKVRVRPTLPYVKFYVCLYAWEAPLASYGFRYRCR